jgi:hypothetical protein
MAWTWVQPTGELIAPDGRVFAIGYAGRNIPGGVQGRNNPAAQAVKGIGPLPCGAYTIGVPEDRSDTGKYSLPLTPADLVQMLGRASFFIHGDNPQHDASHGCIVLGRLIRTAIANSSDKQLRVVSERPMGLPLAA